ncbi:MAG: hypothetical protein K6G33_14785 [Ruminococcus sp.]|uniref:hypothetical protein n=1 Tax=Ruminococcus sp. TaxID=41978 RepID=UPI0025D5F664|nr:hypothetical protein [Ruminococcus sp.]MCR5601990.1 hypothetical protein [Ruminococcus sp.]
MKKIIALSCLAAVMLAGCGKTEPADNSGNDAGTTTKATETVTAAEETTAAETTAEPEAQTSSAPVTLPPATTTMGGMVSAGGIMDMYPAIYQGVVQAKFDEVAKQHEGLVSINYAFRDLDADGIPELLLKYGTCEADYSIDIITLDKEGEPKVINNIGGGHTSFAYDENTGDLVLVWGHMGAASIDYYVWDSGSMKLRDHYDFEINEQNPSYEKVLDEKGIRFIDFGSAFQTDYSSGVSSYLCHPDGTAEDREGVFIYDLL